MINILVSLQPSYYYYFNVVTLLLHHLKSAC